MEKKYQVFVSSTYEDLREERAIVIQTLLESDCIPVGMELFPAGDEEQWTFIKQVIDECDYYIVILAGRYGTLGPEGISYTEMEYRYAVGKGIPVVGFVHGRPGDIIARKTEDEPATRDKLNRFKELVMSKMCTLWTSPEGLRGDIAVSINKLKRRHPAIGWIRADLAPDEEASQEIFKLQRRVKELEVINAETESTKRTLLESLEQGNDSVDIEFTYEVHDKIGKSVPLPNVLRGVHSCKVTWDDLFNVFDTQMITGMSEYWIASRIESFIHSIVLPRDQETLNTIVEVDDVLDHTYIRLDGDIYSSIIVQFLALDLLEGATKISHDKTIDVFRLTEEGKRLLYQSKARKRTTNAATDG